MFPGQDMLDLTCIPLHTFNIQCAYTDVENYVRQVEQ
jgi:hypothetical protein